MKEFIFVSDFDGTISKKDFYQIIMDKYLGAWGQDLYARWKKDELLDVDFLTIVFKSMNRTHEEMQQDVLSIQLDDYLATFIKNIKVAGGDFLILSAGSRYYINLRLAFAGIQGIDMIANDGKYENKGITLIPPDEKDVFYSPRYGIDKAKVVASLKQRYKKVYYAGDSQPDMKAALLADVAFAKGALISLLQAETTAYVPFESFVQVEDFLRQKNTY